MGKNVAWNSLLFVSIVVISSASWWGLSTIERNFRDHAGKTLHTLLATTQQALESWTDSQKATARIWSETDRIIELTHRLLEVPANPRALAGHPAQAELRQLLAPVLEANRYEGFFLIGPGDVNLGSTRDSNLAAKNILGEHQEVMALLWAGKAMLSRPQFSDVLLDRDNTGVVSLPPTMFVGNAVRNASGKIVALLTFRINPSNDFFPILQRGTMGETGETYAFDKNGRLLSNSRFEDQLHRIGILEPGLSSALNIHLHDPGRNLLDEPAPFQPGPSLPLTLTARNATRGISGFNVDGYRDYRGVPVIGAWTWLEKHNFGLVTEIDLAAAYPALPVIRVTVFSLTGFSIFFMIGLATTSLLNRRAILESEKRYRGLIEGASQGIVLHKDYEPILVNQAFAELFGYGSPEEVIRSADLADLLDASERDPIRHDGLNARKAGAPSNPSHEITTADREGTALEIEVFERQLDWKGERATLCTIVNVTDRNQFETQMRYSQKMEAIGRLAGGVAHDLNNNLQIMSGFTEIAQISKDQQKRLNALEKVQNAVKSASQLTRQLLTFSREYSLQIHPLDLNSLISHQVKLLGRIIGEDIQLSLNLKADPASANADTVMIEQVLLNLCINARDAMPDGGNLTISTESFVIDEIFAAHHDQLKPGPYILVTVTDSGIGMEAEVREKVFEPFFTTKDKDKGTGLGLSTVYGIMMQHDGWVSVYSEPGIGTSFRLYLPQVIHDQEDQPVSLPKEENTGGNETLLIAEDDEGVAVLTTYMLESMGYRVLRAADGEEAIRLFEENQENLNLVMLDIVMPKMNGKHAYERIRELAPEMPILFSTGYTGQIIDQEFVEQNAITILRKPFSSDQLGRVIRESLNAG